MIANYAIGNAPTAAEATAISDSLLASYLAGDCDRVELMYVLHHSLICTPLIHDIFQTQCVSYLETHTAWGYSGRRLDVYMHLTHTVRHGYLHSLTCSTCRYTKFTSLVASEPSIRTMLPLNPTGLESEGDEIFLMTSKDGGFAVSKSSSEAVEPAQFPKDMIFEQDPEQILSAILPLYFNGQLLRQMQESVASELYA